MDNAPLEDFFELSGKRAPFLVLGTHCWRGYSGNWSLSDNKLRLEHLNGYIAKGPLVEIADNAFREGIDIDTDDPSQCSKITLADIFPGTEGSVFAHWYSGEINAPLSDEVKRSKDGEDVIVERTLKLGFQDGLLISEEVTLEYHFSRGEIESGLTSADVSVRQKFANSLNDYKPTPAQIERGMLDEDGLVRMLFTIHARRVNFPFTSEQLERALTDENVHLRDYVTSTFREYKFTLFQLERALKDESPRVRSNIAMHYGDQLKTEQIARGLLDKESNVRSEFAALRSENFSDQLTPEQIECGLTDEDEEVRMEFVDNDDVVLSPEQIQRGLKDPSMWIQLEIAARYNCDLIEVLTIDPDDQTIINNLYEINGTKVRKRDLFREGFATELVSTTQDERYRQARGIFNARIDYWRKSEKLDLFSAFKILQQLADENYGKAYYPLSRLYETNRDDEESQERTSHYAKLAFDWCYANRDNQDAELWGDLGYMYMHSIGVEEDLEEAVFWHRKAAEHGDAESQYQLGDMYRFGIGVTENHEDVLKWFRLAADQGHDMALANIVNVLRENRKSRDFEEIAKWVRVAAGQGGWHAQKELSKLYVLGEGVPQDYVEAERYFMLALDHGYGIDTDLKLVQEILRMQKELAAHRVA